MAMHDHHQHDNNNIHYHPSVDGIDEVKVLEQFNNLDNFKGFDDYMYFSYKYWLLLAKSDENIKKAKDNFIQICNKYNKNKVGDQNQQAENYIQNLKNVTGMMNAHDLSNATNLVTSFVKTYTMQDKFIRNFNKRVG